jgi:hypothetical protein
LTLARNLVFGNSIDRRIWPEGGGFPHCASQFAAKFVLILKRLRDWNFRRATFLAIEFSKSVAGKQENRAKLLKSNRGEVAERLNAAVC